MSTTGSRTPPPSRPPTIKEVAQLAGVSIKTVSRVLSGGAVVHPKTARKVQDAMQSLRFVPNPAARDLQRGKRHIVGMAFADSEGPISESSWRSFTLEALAGAWHCCARHDFGLMLLPCKFDMSSAEGLVAQIDQHRLSGVLLLTPLTGREDVIELLRDHHVPYVRIHPFQLDQDLPYVAADNRGAGYEMAKHLCGLGHRRITFLQGHLRGGTPDPDLMLQGFSEGCAEAGLTADEFKVARSTPYMADARAAAAAILAASDVPTAIFASTDQMAVGVMQAAIAKGIRIPEELSVAGFDDFDIAACTTPPLTTMHLPIRAMADVAAAQLIALLEPERAREAGLDGARIFTSELIVRGSTAAPAHDPAPMRTAAVRAEH